MKKFLRRGDYKFYKFYKFYKTYKIYRIYKTYKIYKTKKAVSRQPQFVINQSLSHFLLCFLLSIIKRRWG